MENISKALVLVGCALLFAIGFSYSMYLISKLSNTSKAVVDSIATTAYYDNIYYDGSDPNDRIVGSDNVISTIYRYYKEGYSVKIVDGNEVIQIFDASIEDRVKRINGLDKTSNEYIQLKKSNYCDPTSKVYMFDAPWIGSNDATLTRIEFFLNGTKGYIKNVLVDYSESSKAFNGNDGGFIKNYGDKKFIESFTEYMYSGENVSTDTSLETLTGNTREKNKILITYTVK